MASFGAMAPPGQDAAGKQFNPPPDGLAAAYSYNPTTGGPFIDVMVGPMTIGRLVPVSWMRVELSPGRHAIGCDTVSSNSASSVTLAPGDMRFVDVEQPQGAAVCSIRETGPDAGRAGVLAGTRTMQD